MLTIVDISVAFGGFQALRKVGLEAEKGRITGLVGPNGSGKSTLLNIASGILAPDQGAILLDGRNMPLGRPDRVAAEGIGRTFQIPRLARRLTVLQNMMVGARDHPGERIGDLMFRPGGVRAAERAIEARAWRIADRLSLKDKANDDAGQLSGGQQKLLSMGMLLMSDPAVLLLDEPAAGVNPVLIEQQVDFLKQLRDEGRTILLVEHNMEMISNLCDTVYVLDAGEVIATGTPDEIRRDDRVMRSYLGQRARLDHETGAD
jgi:ABC-type branched-subunit amino acid transport system ATPase component